MSFLSGSTKWAADLPMSARTEKSKKRRQPIPFDPTVGSLPLPATQRLASAQKTVRFQSIASKWAGVKEHVKRALAAPYAPSASLVLESVVNVVSPAPKDPDQLRDDNDEVDATVVDRSWSEDFETVTNSDAAETASSRHDGTVTDQGTFDDRPEGWWALPPLAFTRRHLWPRILHFYTPRFSDAEEERLYEKEVWGQSKRLSLWASVYFIANCILALLSIQDPVVLADQVRIHSIQSTIYFSPAYPRFFSMAYVMRLCSLFLH